MAHFRATIEGQRGEASRLGSKKSGISATVNGWDAGIRVVAMANSLGDRFDIYQTGGSNGHSDTLIGSVRNGEFFHVVDGETFTPNKEV